MKVRRSCGSVEHHPRVPARGGGFPTVAGFVGHEVGCAAKVVIGWAGCACPAWCFANLHLFGVGRAGKGRCEWAGVVPKGETPCLRWCFKALLWQRWFAKCRAEARISPCKAWCGLRRCRQVVVSRVGLGGCRFARRVGATAVLSPLLLLLPGVVSQRCLFAAVVGHGYAWVANHALT